METSSIKNVRIGDVLLEYGYITQKQLEEALDYQKQNKGKRIGAVLIELGAITERQVLQALAQRLHLKLIDISTVTINIEAVGLIPQQLAEKYDMLAIDREDNVLTVAVNDPMNLYAIEDIRQLTGLQLQLLLTESKPLERAIRYYYSEVSARKAAHKANRSVEETITQIEVEEGDDDDTPIVNLLNSLISRAYETNTSDIHIEPFEKQTIVRMRIDGVLVEYVTLQKSLHHSLIARIKIIADLDIAEKRIPQDGHFRTNIEGNLINIRVSVIPTVFGEKAVLRLLASNSVIEHEHSYGMNEETYEKFSQMLKSPNGIIYLTGPTGSGKSTTLYMVLEELSKRKVNISTIEDPVEKNVPRINQMQVNNVAGLTFETGLRALLRQDPDIIMVGETRDTQTATISVRAAITGHLVFSTLHTNDACSSIIRLSDMGLERYMIASSLVGVVAQRLMRKICPECATEVEMTQEEEQFVGHKIPKVMKAKGCPACNYTGYKGRIAIHEILNIDRTVREMILDGATVEELKDYAVLNQGMKTLKESGIELVEKKITTMEELIKVAYYS